MLLRQIKQNLKRNCFNLHKRYLTNQTELEKNSEKDEISKIKKPIKNEPFIKSLFAGTYEKEYLKFPEYSGKELSELESFIKPIEKYYQEDVKSFDKIENYTENFVKLKDFQLYALSSPNDFGGLDVDSMKFSRILESLGTKPGLCIQLIIHNELILKSLYIHGSLAQKHKYFQALSNGSLKAGFCFSEPHTGVDAAKFNLIGKIDVKSNKVYLNGKKSWVTLPTDLNDNENILLVCITKVLKENQLQDNEDNFDITAFLVEKSSILEGELKLKKQLDLINGVSLYEIEFNNVCVSLDISQLGSSLDVGYQLTTNLYENSRHLIGAVCVGLLKDLYKTTIEHSINNIQFERSICEFQMIKERLCKIESRLYAMESMTYLTSGIIDSYELADVALESALTKIYCTEALKKSIDDCIQILTMSAYKNLTDIQYKYLNSVDYLLLFSNTNDVLRHYVAFHGSSASAIANAEKLRKLKDFYNNPGFSFKNYLENLKKKQLLHKKDAQLFALWESVHPSFKESAFYLEQSAARLINSMEFAFLDRGSEIVDYQLNMKRLAEMSLEIYLMNACIARASRSYSIGLHNCDFEYQLATSIVYFSKKRFDFHYNELFNSSNGTNMDNLIINIADRALKERKHSSQHCLNRTYN